MSGCKSRPTEAPHSRALRPMGEAVGNDAAPLVPMMLLQVRTATRHHVELVAKVD